jgi:glycine/D-amino acid oxidase-like deaminating enzyme
MSEFSSDFACGPHPEDGNVLVTAGYTGEGFKFGPVLGELLGDMVLRGEATRGEERVPDMERRFSIDKSLTLFPPESSEE